MKPLTMPIGANIPKEWVTGADLHGIKIVVPSWSMREEGAAHMIVMDHGTRELRCDCKGFQYRQDCHHVRGLIWFCFQPAKRRGVQRTSVLSYHQLLDEGLGAKQIAVLELLQQQGPMTDRQIEKALGWRISSVTGRRNELVDMGAAEIAGRTFDQETNRNVFLWEATI